jgi:hypothetical protein
MKPIEIEDDSAIAKTAGPHLTHYGKRFLQSGKIPASKRHIGRMVDNIMNEMVNDLGGEDVVTASQRIIISTIRQNLVFIMLVNEWITKQPSLINEKGEMLGPLNGFYLTCQNAVTRNCQMLGLKRVKPIQSLEGYLKAKAKEAHNKQTSEPTGKQARESEIVPLRAADEGI